MRRGWAWRPKKPLPQGLKSLRENLKKKPRNSPLRSRIRLVQQVFCFVSGHDFSRADPRQNGRALAPATLKSRRNPNRKKAQGLKIGEPCTSPVGTSESSPGR